jgi:hypothetical protein
MAAQNGAADLDTASSDVLANWGQRNQKYASISGCFATCARHVIPHLVSEGIIVCERSWKQGMRGVLLSLAAVLLIAAMHADAAAEGFVNFDRPIFTTEGTPLCARQDHVAALRRALDDNDRATMDRILNASCKLVGSNIRLGVVGVPGYLDPDIEVRVISGPGTDRSVPRGNTWTLKALLRN